MSFKLNSDREQFRAISPAFIGDNQLTIRGGTGSNEIEILRTQLDPVSKLPRVGINRTGSRIDVIRVDNQGGGYTTQPTVLLGAPQTEGGVQALASAVVSEGRVVSVIIDSPGEGYTSAPGVSITGGDGVGATATSFLDTVDFELDINGAIRTSTSIISDTARILNLDIDNLVTPDAQYRAPNLKTFINNTGTPWAPDTLYQKNTFVFRGPNVYQSLGAGTTSIDPLDPPLHIDGIETNGTIEFKHVGFRVSDENEVYYNKTGESGIYPRSITPILGDKSDKIATTEYVLNLATNDVGGRIYVSQLIGNDENDGRSAVAPVRTIKKACQLAWETVGIKESIIISGGDYVEDNPISIPPDASIVGDNLRLVIIRPANPRKHIFKFGDKNYVIGVTYRDQIDSDGFSVATWDFAMVFDDKQRITYDYDVNGNFDTTFPIGHQIFGEDLFRATFQSNGGLSALTANQEFRGVNAGGIVKSRNVDFSLTTGPSAFINGKFDFEKVSGSVDAGETLVFAGAGTKRFAPDTAYDIGDQVWTEDNLYNVSVAGTSGPTNPTHDTGTAANGPDTLEFTYIRDTYSLVTTDILSIRAEGEVVFEDRDTIKVLPISRIDFAKQGTAEVATGGFGDYGVQEDLGGIVFYTNPLVEADNIHDFKEGQEIEISGLSTSAPDLSFLMGKQRIYKVIEDPDGRSRRFVIPKKAPSLTNDNYDPGQFAQVTNYSKSVTLSLLNSPNKFSEATIVARRFQDAVNQIRNNRDFIADEVVSKVNDQFKQEYFFPYDISGTPDQLFTPTNVVYDPASGIATFTVNGHGLSNNDGVRIADDSIVFTCGMDGDKTEHAAPQSHHFAYGKTLPIQNVTTNTFDINVGASGPNQQFTPSGATYSPSSGELVLDIGPHTLDIGEGIVLDDNSMSFTCDMDNNDSVKTYPRPGIDPYAGRSIPIVDVDKVAGTITLNVGVSAPNRTFQPLSGTTYDAATGDLVMNLGPQHGLGVGRSVVLADNSFTFTCDQDGNVAPKTYPRPGQDPYAGKSIPITAVSQTFHTPSDADYDAATGIVVFEINGHGFSDGDYIKIDDDSLEYTCVLDGNVATKSYPRAGYDYPSGRWLEISNTTTNTFEVNIGASSYTGDHTFVSADPNSVKRLTGNVTINVGNGGSASGSVHTFISATANAVQHLPQSSHSFQGATSNSVKHLPQSVHTFVRAAANSLIVGGSEFKIFLGPSRFVHTYVSGGTITYDGQTANVTNFVYDNIVRGEATITIDTPIANLVEDGTVLVADILLECTVDNVVTQKTYPSFSIPVSDEKCRRDVKHFINAITADLEFGSNNNVIDAAKKYIDGTNTQIDFVNTEIIQTVRAFEYTRELMVYAMRKWRTGDGSISQPVYTPVYSSVPRYFDDTVINDLDPSGACNNVKSAIDTLAYLFNDVLANNASGTVLDGAYLIARNRHLVADSAYRSAIVQYPSLGLNNIDERKCRRDINYIIDAVIRDLVLGGNFGIVNAAESYFTGTELTGVPTNELGATRYAFTEVRDLLISAMRNWKDSSGNAVVPPYSIIPAFTDNTILADPNGDPLCAGVESAITAQFLILDQILGGTILKGATAQTTGTLLDVANLYTYADSIISDLNGTKITVRATYDDNPIIEASPYTQNASIISKLGGNGALIDGSKVKKPNCPFPGLTVDGAAKFPNQGKSMVASAFTIVSEGGIGYQIIEDGYVQLVSVFCIFCADGVLADTGGYASITNSATNFGIFALRSTGFRREAYTFDVGTINNVSSTPTGRTILAVSGLGREPLEHYVGKIDGFENINPDIEYFVDEVEGVTVGPPFSAQLTFDSGSGGPMEIKDSSTNSPISLAGLVGQTLRLHRPSIVNSSSHTWEYAGSGTSYLALPENGGTKVEANEQVSENYGRTYVSGTDELGDFKVGTFARIENRTGNITFTGTVTISEVEFLKLKGGDVVVTGFDNSNTLGGANSTDSKLPTQKAVKDFITNNLGPYINKPYSTNPVPRALVELTDSGKISEDQIPPLRPFQVYTVANQPERIAIEGALAGDIAIQQDLSISFILNNDNDSLFASFPVDTTLQFTLSDIYTGSTTGGKLQATEYRQGVVYQILITDGGSGYITPPVVTFSGGNPQAGAVSASAECTIANGQVVIIEIVLFNGFVGGKGYTTPPTITIAPPAGSGTQASANTLIESRLYGDIVNNIKIIDTDNIQSSDLPPETINITRVVNTSASDTNNWVSLSADQIAANQITSGVISTARLATNAQGAVSAANSFTFLRGDQAYAPAVQTVKGPETRYFAKIKTQANSGASTLIFEGSSNFLLGHAIKPITGIQTDTNISGVLTESGETTVTIDKFLTATLPADTVIEFDRGASPLTFESSQTQGGFVDQIVIQNGGSNFDAGPFFNVPLSGGNGTDLRVNIITTAGVVTDVTIVNGGSGYGQNTNQQNVDFIVSSTPSEIGAGSGLILLAKVTTVLRQYANVAVDIDRVSNLTTSGDAYGTLGVARFKKSQFIIGESGNGSIDINTGPNSGLDADTLDGAQGTFYTNAGNLSAGVVPVDRLSGTYNISIANQSGNTLRLKTSTGTPVGNPDPNEFSAGIISDTKNNSADGLFDGGTRHLVMTIRNGGSDFDATFGGVRQLAFTDGTASNGGNMWLRGSFTSPANQFGGWNKIWSSGNDGELSGLDADKMDGRQGKWYQTATHMNYGILSDERLPFLQTQKDVLSQLRVVDWLGNPRFKVLVRDELLGTAAPFLAGLSVNLYDNGGNGVGELSLTKVEPIQDVNDAANNYTMLTGTLISGDFTDSNGVQDAYFIGKGGVANAFAFQDYSVAVLDDNSDGLVDGTFEVITAESSGGNARLKIGRADGVIASDPSIYFRSSVVAATNYNVALIATGGNNTDGSGGLEVKVADADQLTLNGNKVWNAGNITFNSSNVASTGVIRDASGNFEAGTITAALTGAASLNVLKAGDTMSGALIISGITAANQALSTSGRADFLSNVTIAEDLAVDTDVFFVDKDTKRIGLGDASPTYQLDVFQENSSSGNEGLTMQRLTQKVSDLSMQKTFIEFEFRDSNNNGKPHVKIGAEVGENANADSTTLEGSSAFVVYTSKGTGETSNTLSERFRVDANGHVGIGTIAPNSYKLEVIDGDIYTNQFLRGVDGLYLGTTANNDDAPIFFNGATGSSSGTPGEILSNFRMGNNILAGDVFEITPQDGAGSSPGFKSTPAFAIKGSDNQVAINTLDFGGQDQSDPQNIIDREYKLNVGGDMNINGILYQNNEEFVTSRWTESSDASGANIYRLSKVGINIADPSYTLQIAGDVQIEGTTKTNGQVDATLYANGQRQWVDSYGIIKVQRTNIAESVTIPTNVTAYSVGDIVIDNNAVVTIATNGTWLLV